MTPNLDIERLTQTVIAQVTGGLLADLIAIKARLAIVESENSRLKTENAHLKKMIDEQKNEEGQTA